MEKKNKTRTSQKKIHPRTNGKHLTVFLTGLCGLTERNHLHDFLASKCKGIIDVSLPKKANAGYAFVDFKDAKSVKKALGKGTLRYKGRELLMKPYIKGEGLKKYQKEVNSRRIFVSRIPLDWDNEKFIDLFGALGDLESGYIIKDRQTGESKGFGYATYTNKEDAEIVAILRVIEYEGAEIQVKMHDPNSQAKDITNKITEEEDVMKEKEKEEEIIEIEHCVKPTTKSYFTANEHKFRGRVYRLNYNRNRNINF